MPPVRLQLSRKRNFSLIALSRETNGLACENVARPGKWGNPRAIGARAYDWAADAQVLVRDAGHAVALHRDWMLRGLEQDQGGHLAAAIAELSGRNLACWCALDQPCHADLLLELANRPADAGIDR